MTRPKIVLFDLGKVLVEFDWLVAARRLAPRCTLGLPQFFAFLLNTPLLVQYERGELSNERFFDAIQRATGYRGNLREFAEGFGDIFTEIPAMVRLHARVRAAGVPTYIFSNTNDFAVALIRRRFPFFADFDGYFLSYEIHALKPEPRIYEAAEARTGCRGAEILYLDDNPANVEAGAARGWQVIQHVSPERTIPDVERRLGL